MNKPLSEYPRPQLQRDSYLCLNGVWKYAVKKDDVIPEVFLDEIVVPFSPECELSRVNRRIVPSDYLFYQLIFSIPKEMKNDRYILHFGAIDQIADVYINNQFVGNHVGGFLPFEFDITPYLVGDEVNLTVRVKDVSDTSYYSRGKQRIKRGGIWYTPQSGIYMPVWLESVSDDYVRSLIIKPNIDEKYVEITVNSRSNKAKINILDKEVIVDTNVINRFYLDDMRLWSPEDPYLYPFTVETEHDKVTSYFAMRKFSTMLDKDGINRLALNNKPYFMKGVLDQGYYDKSGLTPRCDEDYINDITLVKSLGFNTIRKHIKIESMRFYYHADRLGVVVWQDFVNGGREYKLTTISLPLITNIHHKDNNYKKFSREDEQGRIDTIQEFKDTIELLYNVPSIGLWTIFNEGWGQFDSESIYKELVKLDDTRLYDHASGWHDQGCSDVKSLHVYFKAVRMPKKKSVKGRSIILSECGGYSLAIANHTYSKKKFGYKLLKDQEALEYEYLKFMNRDILPNIPKGLSAFIYTELSDVEDELNGFITFDREIIKVNKDIIKRINKSASFE